MRITEEKAAEVIKICDAVTGWVEGEGWGVLHYVCEELFCQRCFVAAEEEFEDEVGEGVDADFLAFGSAVLYTVAV